MGDAPFSRVFAMPSANTFSIPPVRSFVASYLDGSAISVDPFARSSRLATYTNDLDPSVEADHHMDAEAFCIMLGQKGVQADVGIFDPPYSPRQIAECYRGVGLLVTGKDTQNARLYRRVRDALDKLIKPGGVVLSFGWNSAGMGKSRGYRLEQLMLVSHGGAHNDTICIAERKPMNIAAEMRSAG